MKNQKGKEDALSIWLKRLILALSVCMYCMMFNAEVVLNKDSMKYKKVMVDTVRISVIQK